jgi:hypothetical protein
MRRVNQEIKHNIVAPGIIGPDDANERAWRIPPKRYQIASSGGARWTPTPPIQFAH